MTCKTYTGKSTINIYHGDCMKFMQSKQAKSYDLAICDPPYGIEITKSGRLGRYNNNNVNWDNSIPTKQYFNLLFDVSENQIIWGGNYFELPPNKCFIIWDKKQPENISFASCEYAWASFDKVAKTFYYSPMQQNDRFHPTQKPVALYKWLLTNYAKAGDKILDTHGGSMSIAIACWDLGFDLDIIELDEDYYYKAVERFENHFNQKQLFIGV